MKWSRQQPTVGLSLVKINITPFLECERRRKESSY
ncbi:hypothetical protein GBAR_LOCUS7509 [Geodia barretti]|uniref:Uncharacterized protein n=1 Tax=Geodia barretti TaxID=519541 RepID=A0AA35RHP9_GEOBA|nr:hypothetical protein GBAR_LOCUS7509 [Geodia barretti]